MINTLDFIEITERGSHKRLTVPIAQITCIIEDGDIGCTVCLASREFKVLENDKIVRSMANLNVTTVEDITARNLAAQISKDARSVADNAIAHQQV